MHFICFCLSFSFYLSYIFICSPGTGTRESDRMLTGLIQLKSESKRAHLWICFCVIMLKRVVKWLVDSLVIFSWGESLRGWAMALWIYTKRTLWAAEVVRILVQSILVLHWNINSIFWCSFACKATVASLSTEGHGVTFILQSVLKEAWNIPEMAGSGSVCRFPSCLS